MVRSEENASSKNETPTLESLMGSHRVGAWLLCLPEHEHTHDSAFLRVDWRLRGAITRALTTGSLSRKAGEVSLLPFTRSVSDQDTQTFKILTLGVKERTSITNQEISHLVHDIEGLQLKSVGLSAKDFGWTKTDAKKHFSGMKGVEVCVIE